MYIIDLYNELRIWRKIKKIAKEAEKKLMKKDLGLTGLVESIQLLIYQRKLYLLLYLTEGYVLMKLREHDKFLMDLGIADYVSPEFSPIEGTDSFLLVLSADREYLKLKPWPFSKS